MGNKVINAYSFRRGAIALCAVVFSGATLAQRPPDAGRILREDQTPELQLPTPQSPGLTIDEAPQAPSPAAGKVRFTLRSIHFSGNAAFSSEQLMPLVANLVGKEIGFDELTRATTDISRFYRESGYPVARAFLPAQQIKEGEVEIAVQEGRFGKVDMQNQSRVSDAVVRRNVDRLEGMPITQRELERRLLLLKDLAGSGDPRSGLRAGANNGESDLTIAMGESPLATGSLSADNFGDRFTGGNRVTAEAKLLSPFGQGDSIQARVTHGFDDLDSGDLEYHLPVGGDGLQLGVEVYHSTYELGRNFAVLNATGTADALYTIARYPIVRSEAFNLDGQVGLDWRDLEDRVGVTGTVVDKSLHGAKAGVYGNAINENGMTVFSLVATSATLDIESAAAKAIDAVTAKKQGDYSTLVYNLVHLHPLTGPWSLYLTLQGQTASKNLDSSERLVLGGANGVRGYPQGEGVGDAGYISTVELHYDYDTAAGKLQPFVFVDNGWLKINERPFITGLDNHLQLNSRGAGIALVKSNDFLLKVTFAMRGSRAALADKDEHTRTWMEATKYF